MRLLVKSAKPGMGRRSDSLGDEGKDGEERKR